MTPHSTSNCPFFIAEKFCYIFVGEACLLLSTIRGCGVVGLNDITHEVGVALARWGQRSNTEDIRPTHMDVTYTAVLILVKKKTSVFRMQSTPPPIRQSAYPPLITRSCHSLYIIHSTSTVVQYLINDFLSLRLAKKHYTRTSGFILFPIFIHGDFFLV